MIGEEHNKVGVAFKKDRFFVVKKIMKNGEKIAKHNHPGYTVLFTVVKGKVKAFLNEKEIHELEPGVMMKFSGDNYINVDILENSEIFVTLIKD